MILKWFIVFPIWILKLVDCFLHFWVSTFKNIFCWISLLQSPGNVRLVFSSIFSTIEDGSFYKTALSRNREREWCKYVPHSNLHCTFSLWFPILTCGQILRTLWVDGNIFCCGKWMHYLNYRIGINAKESSLMFLMP